MYIPYNVGKVERAQRTVSMFKDPKMKLLSLDVVRCASDLAYIPPDQVRDIEFSPMYIDKMRKDGTKKYDTEISGSLAIGTPMQ